MKTLLKVATAAVLTTIATPAFAQTQATGTGNAGIIAPIAITTGDTLEFGTVSRPAGDATGTVTINAKTGLQTVNGVVAVSGGTSPRRGTFDVKGEGGRTFSATLSSLSLTGPGAAIPVTLTQDVVAIDAAGNSTVGIGGTISIPSTQLSGAYTGTYTVTVAYN